MPPEATELNGLNCEAPIKKSCRLQTCFWPPSTKSHNCRLSCKFSEVILNGIQHVMRTLRAHMKKLAASRGS